MGLQEFYEEIKNCREGMFTLIILLDFSRQSFNRGFYLLIVEKDMRFRLRAHSYLRL